jgi:transcription elongation factor GreA
MAMAEQLPVYLTSEGVERFRAELHDLVENQRPALAARLRHAIQQGDLSENADYSSAKEAQAFLEGRILQLEALLRNAVILPGDNGTGKRETVQVGCKVTILEDGGEPETYHLVGPAEASPKDGRISHASPLGQALLGRRAGDRVMVPAPAGSFEVRIVGIE